MNKHNIKSVSAAANASDTEAKRTIDDDSGC